MLGHLGVNVPDLERAAASYGPLMPLLGYEPFFTTEDALAFMPAGGKRGAYLFLYRGDRGRVPTRGSAPGCSTSPSSSPARGAVHEVHRHVTSEGGTVLHPPQEWPQYPPPYFATFWLDPFGIMLEAVCHHDRD